MKKFILTLLILIPILCIGQNNPHFFLTESSLRYEREITYNKVNTMFSRFDSNENLIAKNYDTIFYKDGKYVEKEKTPRQILFEEIFGPSYESHCKVLKTSFNKDSCGVCSGKKVWELFYDSLNRATKLTIIFREKLVYSEYYRYDSLNRLIFSKRTVGEKYACCFLNDDGYVIAYNNYFSSGELIVIKQYSYSCDTITRTSFDSLENKAITKFVYDKNGNLAYKVGYDYRSKKVENKKWTIIYDTKNNPTSISYFLDDKIIYKTEKEYFY